MAAIYWPYSQEFKGQNGHRQSGYVAQSQQCLTNFFNKKKKKAEKTHEKNKQQQNHTHTPPGQNHLKWVAQKCPLLLYDGEKNQALHRGVKLVALVQENSFQHVAHNQQRLGVVVPSSTLKSFSALLQAYINKLDFAQGARTLCRRPPDTVFAESRGCLRSMSQHKTMECST